MYICVRTEQLPLLFHMQASLPILRALPTADVYSSRRWSRETGSREGLPPRRSQAYRRSVRTCCTTPSVSMYLCIQ